MENKNENTKRGQEGNRMNKLNESADLIDKYMDRNIQIERILKESLDDLGNIADSIVQSRPAVAMNIYAIKNKIFKAWRKAEKEEKCRK